MSFADLYDTKPMLSYKNYTEDSLEYREYYILVQQISHNILTINSNVSTINKLSDIFGTKKDTDDIRNQLHKLIEETHELVKTTMTCVKKLCEYEFPSDSHNKFTQQKLSNDFSNVLINFKKAQNISIERQKKCIRVSKIIVEENDQEENSPLLQDKFRMQLIDGSEIEFNESLILERESEIHTIESGIIELNEIFRDLGTIISEQGTMIDNIENNISTTLSQVIHADNELKNANRYQKKTRNRSCCILFILSFIASIVILTIILG
ncbi:hypothetical protein PNEG_02836 [Pneumocystis murina B123]|uniref:t-SNARE coiled-coil homology domain-containing protein n=1 Tax=Pneumocystis murina (strain B123) TaxID=1069680 RepID=M7NPN6_PNEMU|nr:hypothetical protein PNEG_02836 [Pneumocystis murina B123]EMR09066.1 hypothetical protein PNEG_02836 [Pneumocystis murina B123]